MEKFFNSDWFILCYWTVALIFSVLCSIYAFNIHGVPKVKGPSLVHQYFLNFLGSILGWILLWIVFPNLKDSIQHLPSATFNFKDIILTILAFIGITGYLPVAFVGLAFSFKELFKLIK